MVCSIICAPAITLLGFISEWLGLGQGVTGIFLGAIVVWISEVESNWLIKKAKKKGKDYMFKFQSPIITIFNLIVVAISVGVFKLI